jgi:hypothetical protein
MSCLPCNMRAPGPGELEHAGKLIGQTLRGLTAQMIAAGLPRLAQAHWRLDRSRRDGVRHFASCRIDGRDILVHALIVTLPEPQMQGILAHELGHAADYLYPAALRCSGGALHRRAPTPAHLAAWFARSADRIERDADHIARAALGIRLGYTGPCLLQTVGEGPPRPANLR